MKDSLMFVGLDVHQESIAVARAAVGNSPALNVETLPNDWKRLLGLLKLIAPSHRLRVCYEAGPTGFDLARRLNAAGISCTVIAPSLVPEVVGRRIKTDRRDAVRLASLFRAGELRAVHIPEPQVEAMRDLERARSAAKRDERVARHRLDKFLLRSARLWSGGGKWTLKHQAWIRAQRFDFPAQQAAFDHYVTTTDQATARVKSLTDEIEKQVQNWVLRPLTIALQALRGVQLVTAVTLAAEIGNFERFATARQFMAYLGLVPSEHSSGGSRRQGRITRTGNKHVRTILVEAAWNYRMRAAHSKTIEARRVLVAPEVRAIAEKAEDRLTRRFYKLNVRGKNSCQIAVAIARELAGFVWAITRCERLLADPVPKPKPSPPKSKAESKRVAPRKKKVTSSCGGTIPQAP